VLRFLGPVVESWYGPWGVRTHQVGADYLCAVLNCGTTLRVLADGGQRLTTTAQPSQPASPIDPNAKPPVAPGSRHPIPILLPPRGVA
jgi:hypothetical protein